MLRFREVTRADVARLIAVRVATRENAYTREQLRALGITESSVTGMIGTSHRGWLCEDSATGESAIGGAAMVVGFAMGNRLNGEMWVIAVLPEYEGLGIGRRLLGLVEDWLWAEGWAEIWLTTDVDPSLRAYGFYGKMGWLDREIRDGLRYMVKTAPSHPN